MIAEPGIRLTTQPASDWSAQGPLAERALAYAKRFAHRLPADIVPPQRLTIERAAPEHIGLGTGTQLGLAVASALVAAFDLPSLSARELAERVGRGQRSAVGVHGFAGGGFVVEAGRRSGATVAPLVATAPFPDAWRLVVVLPPWGSGLHGHAEEEAFMDLRRHAMALATTDRLCRLILLGMLPALAEHDLDAFGEAVYDFNLRAGQIFSTLQGGSYASSQVADLVAFVRRQGIRGVGQSSWGPAVFAVTEDVDRGTDLASRIRRHYQLGGAEVFVTPASNRGATLERQP